ncbi:unnamed protein product [Calicophoron daubneyi]|uniref:Spectrin beta chain n=1 Tax=Calicophoron daubneyi TaxID=300641 RepID=A0AAV2T8F3_CALDB
MARMEYFAPVSYPMAHYLSPKREDSNGNGGNNSKVYERTRIYTLTGMRTVAFDQCYAWFCSLVERETVQKKTFTKWANTYLQPLGMEINDLFIDLRDGKLLLKLLEAISGEELPSPTLGRMRIHCLENVDKSLYFLNSRNVHLENIGAHDIVDGNARITLGLLWIIILRYQIEDIMLSTTVTKLGERTLMRHHSKDALLLWCQMKTADYDNVDIQNFTTSWRDGLAFNALIHKHRPELVNYGALSSNTPLQNLESAFLIAEKDLGISRLFDPEDIYVQSPDEKSILTYVASYYHYFSEKKSETVRVRRAANFLSYLRDVQNRAFLYENKTSDLLSWISRTIMWLNNRNFPPVLEDVHRLLSEFKEYRTREKADMLALKGSTEMDLFELRTKMRAVGMHLYTPPSNLQLSQVNRAWESLEKAEHARELALRDELARQERLLHLFNRFERKVKLRKSWLAENKLLLDQPDIAIDLKTVEAALKKHEALETDVCAYADRIRALTQLADELKRGGFFKSDMVCAWLNEVESLWEDLLSRMRERYAVLDKKLRFFKQFSEMDNLDALLASSQERLSVKEYGDHLAATNDLLQKHELIETDIRSIHRKICQFLKFQSELLASGELLLADISDALAYAKKKSESLCDAYSRLVTAAENRRYLLELSQKKWQLIGDLEDQHYFIRERIQYIMSMKDATEDSNVDVLLRRYKASETELENRRTFLGILLERASALIEEECPNASVIEEQVLRVKSAWDLLMESTGNMKRELLCLNDYRQFLADCDDLIQWMTDKRELSTSIMKSGLETESLDTLESLIKRHIELIKSADSIKESIIDLREKGEDLLDSSDQQSAKEEDQGHLKNTEILHFRFIRKGNVAAGTVEEKLQKSIKTYASLRESIQHTQATLMDALSLHQLFRMANRAYSWMLSKEDYLNNVLAEGFGAVETNESAVNGEKLATENLKLELTARKFANLESKMSEMANQVSYINSLATRLLEAPPDNPDSLLNDGPTVDRVISMQDNLNSKWNALADAVEDYRDQIADRSECMNLHAECKHTSEWISDKESVLLSADAIDTSTLAGATQLREHISNLEGDLRAIEARIENIGARVANLACQRNAQNVSGQNEDDFAVKHLLQQHANLVRQWMDLKEAIKQRAAGLSRGKQSQTYLDNLDNFQQWLEDLKIQLVSSGLPNDLHETERCLITQERQMSEVKNYQGEASQLFDTGFAMIRGRYDPTHALLEQRLVGLKEDWNAVQDAIAQRGTLLQKRYASQYFFTEASLLEVTLNQQATFLGNGEMPTTLDSIFEACRQHDAFCSSLSSCADRVMTVLGMGTKIADEEPSDRVRILDTCQLLETKLSANLAKAEEKKNKLLQLSRLYQFYDEVEDLRDWINDKTNSVNHLKSAARQNPLSVLNRVEALCEEIEAHREIADHLNETGQKLVDEYPTVKNDVDGRLDRLHDFWDDLIRLHAELADEIGQKEKAKSIQETLKDVIVGLNGARQLIQKAQEDDMVSEQTPLAELQRKQKEYEDKLNELMDHQATLKRIQNNLSDVGSPRRQQAVDLEVNNLERQIEEVMDILCDNIEHLKSLQGALTRFLDLTLEAAWIREKQAQINQLSKSWLPTQFDPVQAGQRLLFAQQLKRHLKSHLLELNNRRPRMKLMCETIEKECAASDDPESNTQQIRNLIVSIRSTWATVDLDLQQFLHEVDIALLIYQYTFDANELEAWISEQELYLVNGETPKDMQSASRALRKHRTRAETINQWMNRIKTFDGRGQNLCSQLRKSQEEMLRADERQGIFNQLDGYINLIQNLSPRLGDGFVGLRDLAAHEIEKLECCVSKFRLFQDVIDLEQWIAEKSVLAASHELGLDLDHCSVMCDRFLDFVKQTVPEGSNRVNFVLSMCVRMIAQGNPDAAEIALAKDSINEAWADLLELIETRKQLLSAALDMYRFVEDCRDTEERITYRLKNLPPAPNEPLISGKKRGLSKLERSHICLEQELKHLSNSVTRLGSFAKKLFPRYSGTQIDQLQLCYDRVMAAWQELNTLINTRRLMLEKASQIHKFLIAARELILWLESTRDEMELKEHPRDVSGVEFLISEHLALRNELDARGPSIEECLNTGRKLLSEELEMMSPKDREFLIGPHGEVRERCVQLATGHLLVKEFWRERWDRLHLLLEVRQFVRDANRCEAWLFQRELQLEAARRQLGETLEETLNLLGAHYAFQQTLVAANERFDALKRLTTLELRAMEWKPQDAAIREQEKKKQVRDVVKEFLPEYTNPSKPSSAPKSATVPNSKSQAIPMVSEAYVEVPAGLRRQQLRTATVRKGEKPADAVASHEQQPHVSTLQMTLRREASVTPTPPPSTSFSAHEIKAASELRPAPVRQLTVELTSQEPMARRVSLNVGLVHKPSLRKPGKKYSLTEPRAESDTGISPPRMLSVEQVSTSPHSLEGDETSPDFARHQREQMIEDHGHPPLARPESQLPSTNVPGHGTETASTSSTSSDISASSVPAAERRGELKSISKLESDQPPEVIPKPPRLEGPVVRKHDIDVGGSVRSKSSGRGWLPVYLVLDENTLYVYKDYRSRRQKPTEYLRNEAPVKLSMARASPALDYVKRPCVFRLCLSDGREYLFQTANDRVLERWINALNDAAKLATAEELHLSTGRSTLPARTQPPTLGRTRSMRASSVSQMAQRRSVRSFFSLRRKSKIN